MTSLNKTSYNVLDSSILSYTKALIFYKSLVNSYKIYY